MTPPSNPFRSPASILVAVLVTVLTSACASTGPGTAPDRSTEVPTTELTTTADVEAELRAKTARWEGTPHRWGGTSRQGVDCSGLLYLWYPTLFGIQLPRTTSEQVRAGEHVRRTNLHAGDLVFFRTSQKVNHVGVYLSDGEFAHASTSNGVMVSHLDEPYWADRYWTARRVLELRAASSPLHVDRSPAESMSSSEQTRRTGW